MKQVLSPAEIRSLVTHHAERIQRGVGGGFCMPERGDLVTSAQRIVKLLKSLPADEYPR